MSMRGVKKELEVYGYVGMKGMCSKKIGEWKKVYIVISKSGELIGFREKGSTDKVRKFDISNCSFFDAVKSTGRACTIKLILKNGKVEYLSADNLRNIDDIKCELEEFKGKFCGPDKVVDKLDKFESKDVKTWTVQDCCTWLRSIGVNKLVKKFQENSVTGQILLAMDLTTFQDLMEIEREFAVNLFDEIRELKREGRFLKKKYAVRKKFKKFNGYNEEGFDPSPVIETLCDPARIKHKFLSTAERFFVQEISKQANGNENTMHQKVESFNTARMKIKLVVTEAVQTSRSAKLKKAVSPLIGNMAISPKKAFDRFHTAVIIGPWYLEWTDSELIVPKRMVSGRAVITADVDVLYVKRDELTVISDKIAEVVAKWNTKYKFKSEKQSNASSSFTGKEDLSGNCQDFVDDILEAIGVKLSFEGALGEFVQRMRTYGQADLQFIPSQPFKDYFIKKKKPFDKGELDKTILFSTHKQLDEFCLKVSKHCFEIVNLFGSDWLLLKSFDRAFWMRHLQDQNNEKYKPLDPPDSALADEFPTGCPFKDPRETKSFM